MSISGVRGFWGRTTAAKIYFQRIGPKRYIRIYFKFGLRRIRVFKNTVLISNYLYSRFYSKYSFEEGYSIKLRWVWAEFYLISRCGTGSNNILIEIVRLEYRVLVDRKLIMLLLIKRIILI
ncbi:hypothetical protein B0T20DRAFT_390642 [Sordaria brevicollis]|uniref:Uncharacterized protein n=1 Tax=Sordaria brevicollis TaxID=83679 RepID=A0AAE0PJR4_SORBR|nr:hypothetical protein B0T20DRAFT_390642 [Sordaria brevicollis]